MRLLPNGVKLGTEHIRLELRHAVVAADVKRIAAYEIGFALLPATAAKQEGLLVSGAPSQP